MRKFPQLFFFAHPYFATKNDPSFLVDVSNIFYFFFARGRGRGSPRRQEGAGVGFLLKNSRGGGGFSHEREGGG